MAAVNYVGWGLPFLLIPASFLTDKMKNNKRNRYLIYSLFLFVAFLSNLTGISFKADYLDRILYILVSFILCEFFWRLMHIKNKVMKALLIMCGVVLFGAAYKDWFATGYQKNNSIWATMIKDHYIIKESVYTVKESDTYTTKGTTKTITLYRDIIKLPFETQIGKYVLPEGYFKSQIRYHWTGTPRGIKLDLISDSDTLWSLGEGL